jgi:hypothetical protein
MHKLGLDIGTKNIALAFRDSTGAVKYRKEVNGFFKIEQTDGFAKRMLEGQGVPFFTSADGKYLIALGEKAENIAYTFGHHLRRPMFDGVLSPYEPEAMNIMAVIIRSIIGDLAEDATLYYCIPGDPLNATLNVGFHQKIIEAIIGGYKTEKGATVTAFPINEARAIVLSSIEGSTGIGISFGAGMVNVSYCLYGLPVYEFSLVGSGDWIDLEAARVTGNIERGDDGKDHSKVLVTKAKEKIDLGKGVPTDNLDRAIYINYELLIEKVAKGIIEGFRRNEQKARAPNPMPIVCAGGTSSPDGFIELFKKVFAKQNMPFEVGEITRAQKPLYAVAAGCLVAATMHENKT